MPTASRRYPTESQAPSKSMIIYVCPTPGCDNFFGAPDFRPDRQDLSQPQEARSQTDGHRYQTHARSECPDCRLKGKKVDRVPYIVTAVLPLADALKATANA